MCRMCVEEPTNFHQVTPKINLQFIPSSGGSRMKVEMVMDSKEETHSGTSFLFKIFCFYFWIFTSFTFRPFAKLHAYFWQINSIKWNLREIWCMIEIWFYESNSHRIKLILCDFVSEIVFLMPMLGNFETIHWWIKANAVILSFSEVQLPITLYAKSINPSI